jgi:hypothetical protein
MRLKSINMALRIAPLKRLPVQVSKSHATLHSECAALTAAATTCTHHLR